MEVLCASISCRSQIHVVCLPPVRLSGTSPEESTVNTLLEQARSAVDPFFAVTLYERALQAKPDDTSIMGHAAELMLQLGQTTAAQEVNSTSITSTTIR